MYSPELSENENDHCSYFIQILIFNISMRSVQPSFDRFDFVPN